MTGRDSDTGGRSVDNFGVGHAAYMVNISLIT